VTRFWWVRHGPTHQKTFTGWRDVPADLSDDAALARLDTHLPQAALLISSDLIRATATADRLAAGRTRLPHDPALREFHFGDWDGRHWSDVAETDPDLSRLYWEEPGDHTPPGGESWTAAAARVEAAVNRLLIAYPGRDIILVAHFGVILTQVQRALGIPAAATLAHEIKPLSVTCLTEDQGGWSAQSINHIP
jgi:alpha-ribazole phosphatase